MTQYTNTVQSCSAQSAKNKPLKQPSNSPTIICCYTQHSIHFSQQPLSNRITECVSWERKLQVPCWCHIQELCQTETKPEKTHPGKHSNKKSSGRNFPQFNFCVAHEIFMALNTEISVFQREYEILLIFSTHTGISSLLCPSSPTTTNFTGCVKTICCIRVF